MGYCLSLLLLSKPTTEALLNISEIALIACGFVLAFGAIGEYLEEHGKLPRWMAWPKLIFILMVVLSLIGEFFSDAGVFLFSRHLQTISEGEFARLNVEAGEARKAAAQAEERAADIYRRLDRQDSFRSLNDEQQRRIRGKLLAFNGTPYDFGVDVTPEAVYLLHVIEDILKASGWKWMPSRADFTLTPLQARIVVGENIEVIVPAKHRLAGSTFCDALAAEGIVPDEVSGGAPDWANADAIHIMIGRKFP